MIIANYNYGLFIEEAINSVIDQTVPARDVEIIVVDDGSDDDSREKIRKYGSRLKVFYQENSGQASAFNCGIQHAEGEIIAFLDSDDIWHKEKLRRVADRFEKSASLDFACHFLDIVDEQKKTVDTYLVPDPCPGKDPCPGASFRERYLRGHLPWFPPTSGLCIKTECMKKVYPIPVEFRIAADFYLHYSVPLHAAELCLIKEPLAYYRMHSDNVSGGMPMTVEKVGKHIHAMELLLPCIEQQLQALGYDGDLLKKRFSMMMKRYAILHMSMEENRLKALKDMIMLNEFLPDDSMFYRIIAKLTTVMNVLSPSLYQHFLKHYRKSLSLLNRTP